MAARQIHSAVQLIRNVAAVPSAFDRDDGALLTAFLSNNHQIAFATIIRRHGPMVLGICQRILNDFHAAEDACQATFILLAQQASGIRKKESLAGWLHGVGLRMARQTRRAQTRRHRHEGQPGRTKQTADPAHCAVWQEIQTILDEEIQALPKPYREPFIRHCLEEASCAEVAHQLGLEEATVRKRLMRARKRLQGQLEQRGISLTAVLAGIAVSGTSASTVFAKSLIATISKAATHVAQGQPLAVAIPQNVIALVQGVSKAMYLTKMKVTVFLMATIAILGSAFGLVAQQIGGATPTPLETPVSLEGPALVQGKIDSLQLPTAMPAKLGIQIGEVRPRAAIKPRVLQLNGSTALDPAKLVRIRGPVTRCEVIEIGQPETVNVEHPFREVDGVPKGASLSEVLTLPPIKGKVTREIQPGDKVSKGQILALVNCMEVGQKKNELFDAVIQLKLDEMILERAEKAAGAVPEVFILNAKKSVLSNLNTVTRTQNSLKIWGVTDSEIEAVRREAREAAEKAKPDIDEKRKLRMQEWLKVALRAPIDGIIVERNISVGELFADGAVNLFQIANMDRLLVIANAHEEDLPSLELLKPAERRWSVKPAGGGEPVVGGIDEIGYLIDPKAHTAIVKGYVDNKDHQLRAGQFVTASITLPLAADEMSLAATAVVEEKGQSFVFVQPNANKPVFEQRRIVVVRRGHDVVHIRTKLTAEQEKQGFQTIKLGERVVTASAIELKAILDELKTP
jgi:cobalt-zinc-cadmium efflux system membrane fusion protein